MDLEAAFMLDLVSVSKTDPNGHNRFGLPPTPVDNPGSTVSLLQSSLEFASSPEMLDSEDDFGDFKFVPASMTVSQPERQDQPDVFDMCSSSTGPKSHVNGNTQDVFDNRSFTLEQSMQKLAGNEAAGSKSEEANTDDDEWGEFVGHQQPSSHESDAFDWLNTDPHVQQASSAPSFINTPCKQQAMQAAELGLFHFNSNDYRDFKESNVFAKEYVVQEPNDLCNGSPMSLFDKTLSNGVIDGSSILLADESTSGQTVSHTRMGSVIKNAAAPIPLSLFGVEELENGSTIEEITGAFGSAFNAHSKDNASNRQESLSSDFIDLVASGQARIGISDRGSSQPSDFVNLISSLYENSPFTSRNKLDSDYQRVIDFPRQEVITGNRSYAFAEDGINGIECSSLEVQLFDLNLMLENSVSYCQGASCKRATSEADMEEVCITDYNELLLLLIGDGRIHEALSCREHIRYLSSLKEGSDMSEEKKALSRETGTEASGRLATRDEICRWQIRGGNGQSSAVAANAYNNNTLSMQEKETGRVCLCHTYDDMMHKLGSSLSDCRSLVFQSKFHPERVLELARRDMNGGCQLLAQAAWTFWVLASASVDTQLAYVRAWESMLAVCASELEHACSVWKQARSADVHLALLAHLEGKKYFAAVGQVYCVSIILAAASNAYRPWLAVASKEGINIQKSLEQCKAAWVATDLKNAVYLALAELGTLSPFSRGDMEGFATCAYEAALLVARLEQIQSVCELSLLPFLAFPSIPSVDWSGSFYLLPLANLWANCLSIKPPKLPLVEVRQF